MSFSTRPTRVPACARPDLRRWSNDALPPGILPGWCAEEPLVLAAELRDAFVADRVGHRRGFRALRYQAPTCVMQADVLLVLQRAQSSNGLEAAMENRHAHAGYGHCPHVWLG